MTGLVVGIGARRGVRADAVRALLARVAREHGLDLDDAVVATVSSKLGEPGLLQALAPSVPVGVPAATLDGVAVPHPSGRVARAVGTASVAEAAALHTAGRLAAPPGAEPGAGQAVPAGAGPASQAGAGPGVTLVVPKTAGDGVTVAVARYHRL